MDQPGTPMHGLPGEDESSKQRLGGQRPESRETPGQEHSRHSSPGE
jgi:hypothetical protein